MLEIFRKKVRLWVFALVCCLVNLVLYNVPFLQFVVEHATMPMAERWLMIVSMFTLLITLNFFAVYLFVFLLRRVGKWLIALWTLLNGFCSYFVVTYHNFMDDAMMLNVLNTRYSEASGFFSWQLVAWTIVLGVVPAVIVLLTKVNRGTWRGFGKYVGGSLLASVIIVLLNFNQILWISKYETELGALTMPWSYTVNMTRMVNLRMHQNEKEELLPDAKFKDNERSVMVLVIGESARKANFQLYGYERATNPELSTVEGLHVFEAQSCATYTTAGVKSILEYKPSGTLYEILPNYLYRTGADVEWRTSNWGEPPVHVGAYLKHLDLKKTYNWDDEKHDELLIQGLKERILSSKKAKVLIVLHTSTSHGPEYQIHYPADYEIFKPIAGNVEDARKDLKKLINAYDNSIIYTDHILRSIIDTLQSLEGWHSAMLYVSDHGESLGEGGMFMHGVPKKMAPKEQYEIPFLLWTNDSFRTVRKPAEVIDQHYVFHTVIDYMGMETEVFDKEKSLFE